MDFGEALRAVKDGGRARRVAWESTQDVSGWWMVLYTPDDPQVMPVLMMRYETEGIMRPFAGSNWDLLADDWKVEPR